MRIVWAIVSILLTYLLIIITGVIMPTMFNNFFMKPIEAYRYLYNQVFHTAGAEFFYIPERNKNMGVTIHNKDKAYEGYTLMVRADETAAYLMDMDGNPVHTWEKTAEQFWQKVIVEDQKKLYFWMRATLNPESGDLYVNPMSLDALNSNLRSLSKLNKNSEIMWQGVFGSHHDSNIGPDNNIYALAGKNVSIADPDFPTLRPPFSEETLVILTPEGEIVKEISFLELFRKSKLKIVLDRMTERPMDPVLPSGDVFHLNSFSFVPPEAIGKAPMLKEGHILFSLRNMDLLVMVDPEKEEITWASYGPFKGQHSPEILDDGSVLLFDNLGNLKDGGHSRILQLDLNDMSVMWEYTGTEENPLWSWHSSHVQALPNGNILITEAEGGRIFEITKDKEIVWEYWVPKRYKFEENGPDLIPVVFSGKRFSASDIKFLDHDQ